MNDKSFWSLWYVRALIVLIALGVLAALVAYTQATLQEAKYGQYGPTTINVSGEGEVVAKPDIGQFSFSVRAEGDDAASAQNASAESINEILSYLEEAGVEEEDIKTQNYYLNPNYRYETRVCPEGSYCPPGDRVLDGYEVTQSVVVKVRDLDAAGDLISGVGQRGATNLSQLQFTIDDESALKADARAAAIADARAKAERLAEDLDVRIVRLMSYYEEDRGDYYGMGGDAMMKSFSSEEAAMAPQLPTGENVITTRVSVTFEVR